jgi:diguanylate cyclase (GGDEF)-like protein
MRKELQDQVERQVHEIQRAYRELETGRHELTSMNDALTEANERLKRLATIDPLTGILNRRAIFEVLEKCVGSADRTGRDLSILMVDIDHFKQLNDMHGHIKGDIVLKSVANILKSASRMHDEVGRFGGEEFLVVLPDTGPEEAIAVAERIRREIQAHEDEGLWVTVSAGVATYQIGFSSIEQFVDAADKALYESKRRGRNRVIHVRDITEGAA